MAIFDQSTLGTTNNRITFNDYTADPIYRAIRRTPLRKEVREFDLAIPESDGITDFQTFIGKEYLVIDGKMYPSDEATFYTGRAALRKATSLAIEQADALADEGYVPYIWEEPANSGNYRQMNVKPLYIDIPESTSLGIVQPFKILCKIKNPVIINPTAVTGSIGTTNIGTINNGGSYPFSFPVVYGKTTYSASGTVVNAGDLPAYPGINITGPVNVPRITNVTTGEYIEVNTNLNTSSDVMTIFYGVDNAPEIRVNGTSVFNLKNNASTFFKIRPGANELALSGSTIGDGAVATISFYSTWPIS